ncbi:MAG: 3-phosphoshikimate 1-carboxyvinyltransferase [Acidimicrobiales bacterium]
MSAPDWPQRAEVGAPVDAAAGVAAVDIDPARPLRGRLRVPGDKSISHRALLLAALAEGESTIRGLSDGDDVRRTAVAIAAHGAGLVVEDDGEATGRLPGIARLRVGGGRSRLHEPRQPIDVGNSGTGIRLLAGWAAAFPWLTILHGDRYIAQRPMDRVAEPLRLMGASVDGREAGRFPPLAVRGGGLHGIDYRLPVASAQVKAAVLLAGLVASGVTTVREPAPVRAHTDEMLEACGADVEIRDGGAEVRVRASALAPFALDVPGDPSQAAFWVVAACIVPDSDLTIEGVYVGRARAAFLDVLRRMGADIEVIEGAGHIADLHVRHAPLHGTVVAGAEVPGLIDEIPVLAVAAAAASGTTEFRDAAELAVKETNRIQTTAAALRTLGASIEGRPDGLTVQGGGRLHGGVVASAGDHRIAMAGAVAALIADSPTRVEGWDAVYTSYPSFLDDLAGLQA